MLEYKKKISEPLIHFWWKIAATGIVPAYFFRNNLPPEHQRKKNSGPIQLEIVSHCWMYSHFLAYQLSSFVNYPPQENRVIVTVFFSDEDQNTVNMLNFFSRYSPPNVTWNWVEMNKYSLFRRGIGRNQAAKNTRADWVWFTDCDVIFKGACIDDICRALYNNTQSLVYPSHEYITPMLADSDPMLKNGSKPALVDVDDTVFQQHDLDRATGPMQIVHGDVARAVGYCEKIAIYQMPVDAWRKALDDKIFRWLLGTKGVRLNVGGTYRIRHIYKGRYKEGSLWSRIRSKIRRLKDAQ